MFGQIFVLSMSIQERFSQTDRALEEVPTWPNVSQIIFKYIFNVVFCVLVGQDFDHDQIVESEHSRSWWIWGFQVEAEVSNSAWSVQVNIFTYKEFYSQQRNRVKVREGRIGEVTEILAWYEFINDIILDHLDDEIKSTDQSGVWRYLISFKVLDLRSGVKD